MSTLGIVTIGQAPRDDIVELFAAQAPAGTKVILRGALDGLTDAEVDALPPLNGADTLYTRLRGGRDVKISKQAVIDRSPETLAKLRADGCDAIVYACTGEFPAMDGDAGVLFPSRVLSGIAEGLLPRDVIASLARVLGGFGLSALVALPLGIAMGTSRLICGLLEPLLGLIRYMPAPAFIPLLIIYFGLDELPKVLLIFIGTLFFNTLMIMDAVKFVPRELIETARTLGGRGLPILTRVVAPYIAPQVLDAYRINMASAWNLVIVAELVAATEGLGKRISLAQRFLRTDEIFLGLIVIGLIGLAIDLGFRFLMRRSCAWAN